MEKLLTTEEAAGLLRHSRRALERWRCTGAGPRFIKTGGRALYREADLAAFLEKNARNSTSDRGERAA